MAESKVTNDKIFVYFCRPLFVLSVVKGKRQEHRLCQAQHQQYCHQMNTQFSHGSG